MRGLRSRVCGAPCAVPRVQMALQWEDDQLDEPWWEKPWCPLPLRDLMRKSTFGAIDRFSTFFLTASNRSSYGFEQGKALVTREVEAGAGPTSTAWLAALGLILRRSGYYVDEVSGDLSRLNFFPLLLLLLAVARQGNIEAAAVYIIARTLGNMNAEALARYEGFDSPTFADERTSSSEASNTVRRASHTHTQTPTHPPTHTHRHPPTHPPTHTDTHPPTHPHTPLEGRLGGHSTPPSAHVCVRVRVCA